MNSCGKKEEEAITNASFIQWLNVDYEFPSCLGPLVYIINSGFLFVCRSRTIFGNRKGAHVQIEDEKHGNMDTGLNMACTQ